MAKKQIVIWYDPEWDYLEVTFEQKEGYMRNTRHAHISEKVDAEGNILGFSIEGVTALKNDKAEPVMLHLPEDKPAKAVRKGKKVT
ncbi:MAG: DUF2283 domain-containing protein [Chloroflexi bacterium]|nr:DUF2283 domain-containing protein [Chloroflexota bacterium]